MESLQKFAGTQQMAEVLNLLELTAAVGGHTVDLSSKANQVYVDTELAKKADLTYVDTELSNKASVPHANDQLARKADVTWIDELIAPTNTNIDNIQTELDNKVDHFLVTSPLQWEFDPENPFATRLAIPNGSFATPTYVDTEIENVSLMPGPTGPIGPAGPK